ncbi:MAG TPA: hypothetical protein VFU50_21495 [Terriglobales bacterium]|nr:hypothetical protein [Terriglobales bacterium]
MPTEENDRQFEQELRLFGPLDAAPLPARANITGRRWLGVVVAAAVLLTIGIGLLWHLQGSGEHPLASNGSFSAGQMTLGKSQAVLLRATSFDAAMNQLEREGRVTEKKTIRGKHTAFEVLGREGL